MGLTGEIPAMEAPSDIRPGKGDSLGEQLAAIDSSESASPATNDPDKDQT